MLLNLFKSTASKKKTLEAAALAAEGSKDFSAALAARKALVELDPKNSACWLALAEACRKADDPRAAIDAYRQAVKNGAAPASTHLQIGAIHVMLEEPVPAAEHFEKVLEAEPAHADALCMLGVVMNDLGRFRDAQAWLEKALLSNPEFSEAHFNLGLARFETGDFAGASRSFTHCVELRRGKPWTGDMVTPLAHDRDKPFTPRDMGINEVKLKHDCEQLEYLLQIGALPADYAPVLKDYRTVFDAIRGHIDENSFASFDHNRHKLLARTYKRPINIADVPLPAGPLINPHLDFAPQEESYLAGKPNIATLDSFLTPDALAALRRFCRESTIWNNIKPGYLGAEFFDGFCSELLLRLAYELRARMPRVIRDLPLQMMWGFKCDSTLPGLAVHADEAAVNVNFWITEDEANLDPDCGGLLVYEHDAPKDWGFQKFNTDPAPIIDYLESINSVPIRVPYRANRAVIFDSDLFHATDRPRFREGYLNRRINITFLYGRRSM